MKDIGRLKYLLGIEILRSKFGIIISQRICVFDNLLAKIGMIDCKSVDTLITINHGLSKTDTFAIKGAEYQRLVRKLIDLAHT